MHTDIQNAAGETDEGERIGRLDEQRRLIDDWHLELRLVETRKSLVSAWLRAAEVLDGQGEEILAGEVRYFAKHLPPVLTDRQQLAAQFLRFKRQQRRAGPQGPTQANPTDQERTL